MAQNVVQLPAEYRGNPRLERAWLHHADRLKQIDDRFEPHLENATAQVEAAQKQYDRIFGEVNRGPTYARIWYFPFLTALALAEVPVNRLSFELFFGESPILTLIVALLVGVLLMTLAHFAGVGLRRFPHNVSYTVNQHPGMSAAAAAIGPLAGIAICFILIFTICYGVAILRQGYLAFAMQPDAGFSQMIENDQFIQAAAQLALATTLAIEGWIFFWINTTIVAVGVFAAFFCHDPHPEYEKIDMTLKAAVKRQERIKVQYGKARASEDGRFAAERLRVSE